MRFWDLLLAILVMLQNGGAFTRTIIFSVMPCDIFYLSLVADH